FFLKNNIGDFMIRLYTEAAVAGNPGPAGVGILIVTNNEQKQISIPLEGNWNNHHAEFKAVFIGLSWLIKNNYTDEMYFSYTDIKIGTKTIEKKYVKDPNTLKYLKDILELLVKFHFISIKLNPESKNKEADNLARQALQIIIKTS